MVDMSNVKLCSNCRWRGAWADEQPCSQFLKARRIAEARKQCLGAYHTHDKEPEA